MRDVYIYDLRVFCKDREIFLMVKLFYGFIVDLKYRYVGNDFYSLVRYEKSFFWD